MSFNNTLETKNLISLVFKFGFPEKQTQRRRLACRTCIGDHFGFDTCGREGGKTKQSEKLSSASTKASARTLESFSEELGRPFRADSLCGDAVGLSYSHIRQTLDANWSPKREGTVWLSASSRGD